MSFHMQGTPKGVRQRLKPRPSSRSFFRRSYIQTLQDAEAKQKRIERLSELHAQSREDARKADAAARALTARWYVRVGAALDRLLSRAGRVLRGR